MDRLDAWVEQSVDLPVLHREAPDDVALEIGRQVASLVEDRSTIQVGIGQIPDAVTTALREKNVRDSVTCQPAAFLTPAVSPRGRGRNHLPT